jgi:uncharacterized protein YfaS (alpha-2-macroglobulin family)
MIDAWISFQKTRSSVWSSRASDNTAGSATGFSSTPEQAYRLYTLALAGAADLGSMNRLREQANLDEAAAWRLAAAYWHSGQRDTARSLVTGLETPIHEYRELRSNGTFGTILRDKAMILETLSLLGDNQRSMSLLEEISAALSSDSWLSTQETAYALIAAVPFIQGVAAQDLITVDYTLGDKFEQGTFRTPGYQFDLGDLSGGNAAFTVRNRSRYPVYARIISRGIPAEGAERAMANELDLSVQYLDLKTGKPVNPGDLKTGDDMEIRVTVGNTSTRALNDIALVHPLPASWEIINYRVGEEENSQTSAADYRYQDIRDDRVMTYFDLSRGARKTFSFRVNRAYGGNYFRPAVHVYAMYDESIRALVPGVSVTSEVVD